MNSDYGNNQNPTGPQPSSPGNYPGNQPGGAQQYPGNPQQGYPGAQQGYGAPYGQAGYQRPYRPQKPYSNKAIVSLVMGIAGLFFAPLGLITGIIGGILGWMGLKDCREPEGTHRGRGLAIGGLVTSLFSFLVGVTVVLAFVGLFYAIEQEQSQMAERRAEESARSDMYTISDRLEIYYIDNGRSLGPGGPEVKDAWDGGLLPENTPRVQGELKTEHLVRDYDLMNYVEDYELKVLSDKSVTVTCRKAGLKMVIDNMESNYPRFEDIPKTP